MGGYWGDIGYGLVRYGLVRYGRSVTWRYISVAFFISSVTPYALPRLFLLNLLACYQVARIIKPIVYCNCLVIPINKAGLHKCIQ